jgi:hypothetical protein
MPNESETEQNESKTEQNESRTERRESKTERNESHTKVEQKRNGAKRKPKRTWRLMNLVSHSRLSASAPCARAFKGNISGHMQGTFREHSGIIQEARRAHEGNMKGT